MSAQTPLERLLALPPGRHHATAEASGVWLMVGRALPKELRWSSVPPAASLSVVFGEGGCDVEHAGGNISLRHGDWMWIDSAYSHRGHGYAGSDFLTFFIPDAAIQCAGLDLAPIGARAQAAPEDLLTTMYALAALVLEGGGDGHERVALDALLDHVGDHFEPADARGKATSAALAAKQMLDEEFCTDTGISTIAEAVGLRGPDLSRSFVAAFGLTPVQYRKQLRLRAATQRLAAGASVGDASAVSGFSDNAHLSRTFQAQYGITPSAWQRRVGLLAPELVSN
ncbi:MAG: helix-turn-helix domain-containing protein [Myxococcota bacterium]